MITTLERVPVALGDRAYDVLIGEGLLDEAGPRVAQTVGPNHAMVVADEAVAAHYGDRLTASLTRAGISADITLVPPGEASKSATRLIAVTEAILAAGLERDDCVIALGGGVVGDLAGFAAAIARRGMPFVQIPTSLLAQVDSSVGGKTGINAPQGKNLIGAFHQPRLVLTDLAVLRTLSERERIAGYAEIAKIALINDAAFFARLEALGERATTDLAASIATAVAAKAAIVIADEREAGQRALLNLGHTFAHAIEAAGGYDGRIIHGEAVGLGICLAFRLSVRLGLCSPEDAERVDRHIKAVHLPTRFDAIAVRPTISGMKAAMAQDKKVKDGVIRFILTRGIGAAFVSDGVPDGPLTEFLSSEGLT
ncbi:MAG: 3-dehydroquinate synthase [Pseudomonadota bacterium]